MELRARVAAAGMPADIEREAIRQALASVGGHRKKAAAKLGIGVVVTSYLGPALEAAAAAWTAGRLLRAVVRHHLGGRQLQTRKVLREMHRGRIAPPEGPERGE